MMPLKWSTAPLFMSLMQEDTFWDVVGCLEYDPELGANKANHRHFLKVCSLLAMCLLAAER
jgi:hypothetical protein